MSGNDKIQISISKEHSHIKSYVQEFFTGLDCEINSDYSRRSATDLQMQIMIFLRDTILSGAMWKLMEIGIGKLFNKYNRITITIRDGDGTMFTVKRNLKVEVIVIPDRKKEFSHIKNFYDLERYLVKDTKKDELEHRQRFDLVLGIIVAGILGFIINIFADIYYDVFLTHSANLDSYNEFYLYVLILLFLSTISFLQFLIYDYKNQLTLGRSFWSRYILFSSDHFSSSRFFKTLNTIFKLLLLAFLIFVIILIFYSYFGFLAIIAAALIIFIILTFYVIRKRHKRISKNF